MGREWGDRERSAKLLGKVQCWQLRGWVTQLGPIAVNMN